MNCFDFCSLGDGYIEGKTRRWCHSGRPFIFSECWKNMGSIDLEQQQEQKKQGQRQRLRQWLKADVSRKGETRSHHTQVSLPEPQHKPVMGTHLGFISDAALLYSSFLAYWTAWFLYPAFNCVPCFCLEPSADWGRTCPEMRLPHFQFIKGCIKAIKSREMSKAG